MLEGVRGSDFASDIAIDNITVHPGHCKQQGKNKVFENGYREKTDHPSVTTSIHLLL